MPRLRLGPRVTLTVCAVDPTTFASPGALEDPDVYIPLGALTTGAVWEVPRTQSPHNGRLLWSDGEIKLKKTGPDTLAVWTLPTIRLNHEHTGEIVCMPLRTATGIVEGTYIDVVTRRMVFFGAGLLHPDGSREVCEEDGWVEKSISSFWAASGLTRVLGPWTPGLPEGSVRGVQIEVEL